MNEKNKDIVFHHGLVKSEARERLLGQKGCVVWITGLSGSGKSTLACAFEQEIMRAGKLAFVLDGDNVRHGLNCDLGFSPADREENIRRVGAVAGLFADAGLITLVAFISPYQRDREQARKQVGAERFIEVFLQIPLVECEQRDPKGLYKQARAGKIENFTGIDAPYEEPAKPDLVIPTGELVLAESVTRLREHLAAGGFLSGPEG